MSRRAGGGLAFLNDRSAFVRRFVLAQVLGPPRGKLMRLPRSKPAVTPPASTPPAPPK